MHQTGKGTKQQPGIVLIADDAEAGEQLAGLFRSDGFAVTTIGSALGAIDIIKRVRPDLVILDLALPYRSGASLLGSLKSDADVATIPVVIYTAIAETLTRERRALAAAVLEKPTDAGRLVDVIEGLLPAAKRHSPTPLQTRSTLPVLDCTGHAHQSAVGRR